MTPWVGRLIFANVVVFVLVLMMPGLVPALALVPRLVGQRPWSPLTYMFVHQEMWHVFFNMLALYFFGPRLEARLGSVRFLELYLGSGLMGALLSVVMAPFSNPDAWIIGASGATFGVSFGYAFYWPHTRVLVWGIVPVQVRLLVILMTAMSLAGAFGGTQPGVAHFAHLGGFLGGWLCLKWFAARTRAAVAGFAPPAPKADAGSVDRWRRIDRATLHPVNAEELDRVLAKLDAGGAHGLSVDERAFLDRFSDAGAN